MRLALHPRGARERVVSRRAFEPTCTLSPAVDSLAVVRRMSAHRVLPRVSRVPASTGACTRNRRIRPRTRPGKMLRFDFCNRLAWHVHQPNRSTLEVTRDPLARRRHVRRSPTGAFGARRRGIPADSSSHEALDDASRASVVELHLPRASACGERAQTDPAGPRSKGPRSAPPSCGVVCARPGESSTSSDALCDDGPHPRVPSAAGCVLPLGPVKERGLEHTRAPSIDECPLGPALARLTSNADPPPTGGLCRPRPASDALSRARPSR